MIIFMNGKLNLVSYEPQLCLSFFGKFLKRKGGLSILVDLVGGLS